MSNRNKQAIFYTAIAHFYFVFSCKQSDAFWYCMHCYRPTAKVPMNMLGKSVQESSQNRPSVGSHSSLALLRAGTSSESVAASSSLDLDFLVGKAMKTQSSEKTGGPGVGEDGAVGSVSSTGQGRSSALSDILNGMFINLPRIYSLTSA